MELSQLNFELGEIENLLIEIRTLSKSYEDFYDAPYNNDWSLIVKILKDRLQEMKER